MELRAGQRIDHYTLIEPVGEGGQGSVWKVVDPRDGGVVRALKLVSLAEAGPEGFDRARREARILATAEHPALVACHGLFEDPREGIVGLLLDLAPGRSLAETLGSAQLDRARTLALLLQVADALAYLHRVGLVHRDLKPANVVVTDGFWEDAHRPGTVKLVDFGIAAPVSGSVKLTAIGHVIGTLAYLAPELVDPASWGRSEGPPRDVFAFGVMACDLVLGRHPTGLGPGASMIDYARAYKAAEAKRIPWPPEGLEGREGVTIARCLALRPADRPRDGAEILEMLRTGSAPRSVAWSGLHATTTPHRVVTEPSPAPPVAARTAEITEPMPAPPVAMPRTVRAAPIRAAVTPAPRRRGGSDATAFAIGGAVAVVVLAATALWLWLDRPPSPEPVATVPSPTPPPYHAPSPAPAPTDHGACCRDSTCKRRLSQFDCPVCAADPPPLPRRTWWMRVGGVTDRLSADRICVEMPGSGQRPLCLPYSKLPEVPGATDRLPVTTDDVEAGRLVFTLYAGDDQLARGYGYRKAGTHFLASALCMGLALHVEVPRQDDVLVSIYLDDR